MVNEQVKRQLTLLETYLEGRINRLDKFAKSAPLNGEAADMAITELQHIYFQILPELFKSNA